MALLFLTDVTSVADGADEHHLVILDHAIKYTDEYVFAVASYVVLRVGAPSRLSPDGVRAAHRS